MFYISATLRLPVSSWRYKKRQKVSWMSQLEILLSLHNRFFLPIKHVSLICYVTQNLTVINLLIII